MEEHVKEWVEKEVETHTKQLENWLMSKTAANTLLSLQGHTAAIGYKLVPVVATVVKPTTRPTILVPNSQMSDPIEDFTQSDAIDALAHTTQKPLGGGGGSLLHAQPGKCNAVQPPREGPSSHKSTPSYDDTPCQRHCKLC